MQQTDDVQQIARDVFACVLARGCLHAAVLSLIYRELESTQRVQTEDFHVLFLVLCRNLILSSK